MLSFEPKDLSTAALHGHLLSAVAPRPIAFASTLNAKGEPNLSPFSFFNVFSANPPILIFSPARRVRDNTTKHTLENVKAIKEVVINIINYDIVQQASLSSTEYPDGVNEFIKSGLTMLASDLVKPFRVAESPVQFECKVNDVIELGNEGGAGNLVICEVVKLHIKTEVLDDEGRIDQIKLDAVARAGGSYYSRAKLGFFEIPKPLSTLGIGVDALPEEVRLSPVLTGNDLGVLANVEELPSIKEANSFISNLAENEKNKIKSNIQSRHKLAQNYLAQNNVSAAWYILIAQLK